MPQCAVFTTNGCGGAGYCLAPTVRSLLDITTGVKVVPSFMPIIHFAQSLHTSPPFTLTIQHHRTILSIPSPRRVSARLSELRHGSKARRRPHTTAPGILPPTGAERMSGSFAPFPERN